MSDAKRLLDLLIPALLLLLFLGLGAHQLDLPGLHYDEAKEAGLNAMQLLAGQPVTAFREATVRLGPWSLPLMVQDYIGALNVLLSIPFLTLGGVNVVALRWLPLLTGGLTLLLTWRVARRLGGPLAAHATALLLAVNPSFIFWSRQGIFVTNLTALFFVASLVTGLRWWDRRRPSDLWLTALFWGLGLYAKLLFVWAIGAMVLLAAVAWALSRKRVSLSTARAAVTWLIAAACFLLPLTPLVIFNLRTGGTIAAIFGNLDRSYYGVDNSAYLSNLAVRVGQVRTLLRGDHFWYLGGTFADPWAVGLAGGLVAAAALATGWRKPHPLSLRAALSGTSEASEVEGRRSNLADRHSSVWNFLIPVVLLALMVAQSAFTVSDLFVTHYALLLPLLPLAGGLASAVLLRARPRWLLVPALVGLLWWGGADLWTTARYHGALSTFGGHSAHSSAIGDLAAYLQQRQPPAVVALDWGMDAPLRFLTVGQVSPHEIFGYDTLDVPDDGFAERARPFLAQPDTLYLAHTAEDTVFHGRVEALTRLAAEQGLSLCTEAQIAERSGRPLFVVYRIATECPER